MKKFFFKQEIPTTNTNEKQNIEITKQNSKQYENEKVSEKKEEKVKTESNKRIESTNLLEKSFPILFDLKKENKIGEGNFGQKSF